MLSDHIEGLRLLAVHVSNGDFHDGNRVRWGLGLRQEVDGVGHSGVVTTGSVHGAADLDEALNDPNVPESIKKQMKEMLEKMKSLQK